MDESTRPAILIVDDEPEILYSLRGLLRKEFDVHTAASAYDGLQELRRHPFHVVMADQRMPQTTGVEFLRQVRAERPEAVRLIFTGHADIRAVIDAINEGNVYRYLTKPWDPDELVAVLRQASAVYERRAERRRLLGDLHAYQERGLALLRGLREGRFGTLTPEGLAELDQVVAAGQPLFKRLEQLLGPKR